MENNKVINFLKANYVWLFSLFLLALSFVSLATTMLTAKGVAIVSADGWYVVSKISDRTNVDLSSIISNGCFTPLIVCYVLILVAIVFTVFGRQKKNLFMASTLILLCDGIFFLLLNVFYNLAYCISAVNEPNLLEEFAQVSKTELGFGSIFASVICFVSALVNFALANKDEHLSINTMVEVAVFSGLAIGLQFIKIPIGATGGSINLGLIPLFLIALRHGSAKGFLASAVIYGFITCLSDGWGLNTYPFDYLIGFGGCAVLGFFSNLCFDEEKGYKPLGFVFIAIGVVLASLIRMVGSTASSIINYGYSFKAALLYNIIYIPVTGAVSLVAMEVLYIPLAKLNKIFPVNK